MAGRHFVRAAAALALALALGALAARSDDGASSAPPKLLERLVSVAQGLAAKGRKSECDDVLDVLAALNAPQKDLDAARQAATKSLAKAKAAALPLPDAAKTIEKIAVDLAALLPGAPEAARRGLASAVLRLDAAQKDAHAALGHVEIDGRFAPPSHAAELKRRREIQIAVQQARALDVPLVESESGLALIERLYGRKGRCVASGRVRFHSVEFEPGQVEREMRDVMRAFALSNWLIAGTLAVPPSRSLDIVYVSSPEVYAKALADALEHHEISSAVAEAAKRWGGFDANTYSLIVAHGESYIRQSGLLQVLHPVYGDRQTNLYYSHVNWLYANFLGVPWIGVGWVASSATKDGAGETHDTPAESRKRNEMARFARAGLEGTRRFIRWLADRGEDPPWSRSMVDGIGKLKGADLFKSTVVVDYFYETGEFAKVFDGTRGKPAAPASFAPLFEGGLPGLEARWREWLFADEPADGLVQRLSAAPISADPVESAALARLAALRKSTIEDPAQLDVDPDLSAGCRAHAAYLHRHPKQQGVWPDAHEEYTDQPDFTPAGSRAGLSSVICGGITSPEQAIDGWMGTFYHRLPLLHAGLLRIGWGLVDGVAVLDAKTLAAEPDVVCSVRWPPSGAKDVSRRFASELPSPVPGEDQSKWGYPITLQVWSVDDPDVTLRLHVGAGRNGPEVPCHFSSPAHPTNPALVPSRAFCLIPKQTLAASTLYTVEVSGTPASEARDWTFTTGK